MKINERKRAYAERLYIEDGWTAKSIAETVGVSENTISSWVKKYKWREKRAELQAAPHKIRKAIIEEINKVVSGQKMSFNSDDLSKLTRALERLDNKVSIQSVISVFKDYDKWLGSQDVDTKFLEMHLSYHKQYIQYLIEHEH